MKLNTLRSSGFSLFLIFPLTLLNFATVSANPTGGQVVSGGASWGQNGSTFTVNQTSQRVILNWQSFSIGQGELTQFVQPSATSAALNRVVGDNLSEIMGTLKANGQVYLINPNGIVIGDTGVINTAGFTASTHDIADADFLKGKNLTFKGNSTASVQNLGSITAESGDVYLIAKQVENAGTIKAPHGTVGLGAGMEVLIKSAGEQKLFVQPAVGSGTLKNSGLVEATVAEFKAAGGNEYALAIKQSGIVRATSAAKSGGRVYLVASSGRVENTGLIKAQQENKGGEIQVLGQEVVLADQARLDVSGVEGGGTILIGGDYQGQNASIANAQNTFVGSDVTLDASATGSGNGGKVIVWADGTTLFYGTIKATGGAQQGKGGFVETSGKDFLEAWGSVDASAIAGEAGTWLLDPRNVTLTTTTTNGAYNAGSPNIFTPTGNGATANVATIVASLDGGTSVVITTGSTGTQAGNITVSSAIVKTVANNSSLTLTAANNITIGAAIDLSVGGDLIFTAAGGTVAINAAVNTANNLAITSNNAITQTTALTVGGTTTINKTGLLGAVTLNNVSNNFTGAVSVTVAGVGGATIVDQNDLIIGTVAVNAGSLTLQSGGNLTQTGLITQNGAVALVTLTATGSITLTNPNNDFEASVSVNANNASLRDSNDLTLAGATVTNLFTVQNSGTLIQIGALNTSQLEILGSGAVTLLNVNNAIGTVAADRTGSLTILGGNQLTVGVAGATTGINSHNNGVTLSASTLTVAEAITAGTGNVGLTISLFGVGTLNLNNQVTTSGTFTATGGGGVDTFNLRVVNSALTVNAGAAADIINVGDSAATANQVTAAITVNGAGGNDTVNIRDDAQTGNFTYVVDSTNIARNGVNIALSSVQDVSIQAGLGADAVTLNSTVTGNTTANGGAGNDTFTIVGPLTGTVTLDGQGDTNTLEGPDAVTTWNITGSNSGTVAGATFANMQNLTGGTLNDTFVFGSGSQITGLIDGDTGTDLLDFSSYGTPVVVTMTGPQAGGVSGVAGSFAAIENIQAVAGSELHGSGSGDTFDVDGTLGEISLLGVIFNTSGFTALFGEAGADTFNFNTGSYTGEVRGNGGGDTFHFYATLDGNAKGDNGDDTFVFHDGGSVTGHVRGEDGDDTLDYSNYTTTSVTVNLRTQKATLIGGKFSDIEEFLGGTFGGNEIIGDNVVNSWEINGLNKGKINGLKFEDFENLTGGTDTDSLAFLNGAAEITGTIDGRAGLNTLDFSALNGQPVVQLNGVAEQGSVNSRVNFFDQIDQVIGGAGGGRVLGTGNSDTFDFQNGNVVAYSIKFIGFDEVQGKGDQDTFNFNSGTWTGTVEGNAGKDQFVFVGGQLDGTLIGGNGDDTVDLSATNFNVTLTGNSQEGQFAVTTYQEIENVAGSGATILRGTTSDDTFDFEVGGVEAYDTFFTDFGTVRGRRGDDTFNFNDGNFAGIVYGGRGQDLFTVINGSVGGLNGGRGSDAFNFVGPGVVSGTVNGGRGNDFFVFGATVSGPSPGDMDLLGTNTYQLVTGPGFDEVVLADMLTTAGHTYTISGTQITRSAGLTVNHDMDATDALFFFAGDFDDTVSSGFFAFAQYLDGGSQDRGDTLNFDATGSAYLPPLPNDGILTLAGFGPVNYTDFENVVLTNVDLTPVPETPPGVAPIDLSVADEFEANYNQDLMEALKERLLAKKKGKFRYVRQAPSLNYPIILHVATGDVVGE
jgi:filamentous hemagglutinin family protein